MYSLKNVVAKKDEDPEDSFSTFYKSTHSNIYPKFQLIKGMKLAGEFHEKEEKGSSGISRESGKRAFRSISHCHLYCYCCLDFGLKTIVDLALGRACCLSSARRLRYLSFRDPLLHRCV